ncbi:MAG: chitobiase/beta-hexosaminidase C-terminal domain-containing protein [Patescibacteria group bacterium]|jgi:hypothetical protein
MKNLIKNWIVIPTIFVIIAVLIFGNNFYNAQKTDAEVLTWTQVANNVGSTATASILSSNGKIYAGTYDGSGTIGTRLFSSSNGTDWTQVNSDGFGVVANRSTYSLIEFDGAIFAGVSNAAGGLIYRCDLTTDCDQAVNWAAATDPGLSNVNNIEISSLVEYDGYIFAGTRNLVTGAEVWSCQSIVSDCNIQANWSRVDGASGFGDANNVSAASMATFNNALYVGTGRVPGSPTSEVWYCTSCKGVDWNVSNNNGFGDNNQTVQSLVVYDNQLYAGTEKSGGIQSAELWRTSDGTNPANWAQVGADGFGATAVSRTFQSMLVNRDALYVGTGRDDAGTRIWMSIDGATFEQINESGFGNANINSTYGLIALNNYLYSANGNIAGGSVVGSVYRTSLNPAITAGSVTASQVTDGTGRVNISFTLSDPDYNNSRAKVEYSLDNGATWPGKATLSTTDADTTATFGDPKIDNSTAYQVGTAAGYITTSSGANTVNVVWNSKLDAPGANTNNAMIRVTPNDLLYDGTAVSSASFSLDNVAPVISNVTVSPTCGKRNTDLSITVSIDGTQSENPSVTVDGNSATTNNAQAGAESIRYSYRVLGTETQGSDPVVANARDSAGNTSTKSTTVTLDFNAPVITANPDGGAFNSLINVTLTANEQVGKIRYTTNGDDPTVNGTTYRGAIPIDSNTTLKFYAFDTCGNTSDVKTEIYVFDFVAPHTSANPPGGIYENPQAVELTSDKPATIYFTTDGTEPTENSNVYNGRILISENTTLKFFGIDEAGNREATVNTEVYVISSTSPFISLTKTYSISAISAGTSGSGSSMLKKATSVVSNFNVKSKFSLILFIVIAFWLIVSSIYFIFTFFKNRARISKTFSYLFKKQKVFCGTVTIIIAFCLIIELFIGYGTRAASVSRGDFINYRIDYINQGAKSTADLRIVDSISSSTTYITGSINVNGVGRSDSRDNDNADYNETNPGAVTVDIGVVDPNNSGFIEFQVQVNSDVPFGTVISNKGIGSYNPGAIFTESNIVSNTVSSAAFGGPIIVKKEEKKPVVQPKEEEKNIEKEIEKVVGEKFVDNVIKIFDDVLNFLKNKDIQQIINNYVAPIITALTALGILAAIPFINSLLPYLAYLLQYLTHPVLFFGKRKRWGIVFDSLSKQPLDLAIVRLFNKNTKKLLATRITDVHGRYLFIVDPGDYYITVAKPYYIFPSKLTTEKTENTYIGETISVQSNNNQKEKGVIAFDIPLDPQEGYMQNPVNPSKVIATPIKTLSDLQTLPKEVIKNADNQLLKVRRQYKFNQFVAIVGPIIGLFCLIISPSILTAVLFVLDIILFFVFRRLAVKRMNSWGKTIDQSKHKALPKTIVRLFDNKYGRMLLADISKGDGRYGFLAGKDKYVLTSQKSGYELPQNKIEVQGGKEGVISQNLELKKVIKTF